MHYNGCLSLLSTCRQIYAEAKLLPFSLNTLSGYGADLRDTLHHALAAWQLNSISGLRIHVNILDIGTVDSVLVHLFVPYLELMNSHQGVRRITVVYASAYELPDHACTTFRERMLEGLGLKLARQDTDIAVEITREQEYSRAEKWKLRMARVWEPAGLRIR